MDNPKRKQAYGIESQMYVLVSSKYNSLLKIYALEQTSSSHEDVVFMFNRYMQDVGHHNAWSQLSWNHVFLPTSLAQSVRYSQFISRSRRTVVVAVFDLLFERRACPVNTFLLTHV
jgi:hypothetical protein